MNTVAYRDYFVRNTQRWLREFLKYFGASVVALGVDAATLLGLVEGFGMNYLAAAATAYIVGAIVLYIISVRWVFHQRKLDNNHLEFMVFSFIGLIGLAVTMAVMAMGTGWLGLDYRISKVGAAGTSFVVNFVLRKTLLFSGMSKNAIL